MSGRVVAVVLAGGSGTRFGAEVGKVYVTLGGRPILAHSLGVLHADPVVDDVVVVIREGDEDLWEAVHRDAPTDRVRAVVPGGSTRQRSEWAGITAVRDRVPGASAVLLHDAARPFLTHDLIVRLVGPAGAGEGAIPAIPLAGDLVDVDGQPVDTRDLVAVQTPQAFPLDVLLATYPRALAEGFEGVDTAQTVQAHGDVVVRWVPADPRNLKVTHPEDLARAEALLPAWRGGAWA